MGLFAKKNIGFMDVIRCDEPSYLIWKWHPNGEPENSGRANAIRWGSSLRVKDGEVAVFVYGQMDGTAQDYIVGPADIILNTDNLPVLSNIIGLAYNGESPFQAEVYFINLAGIIQVPFGVPYFDMFDERYPDFGVPTAIRGQITFNITDYEGFIKQHRMTSFSIADFKEQIRSVVPRYIKEIAAKALQQQSIPLVQIEKSISTISEYVEVALRERLAQDQAVNVTAIDISAIELDKSSEGYEKLMAVSRDVSAAKIEADTEDYTERKRIVREEEQYAVHMQTQSNNLDAFRVEKEAEVGIAGANALGQMGHNGGADVNVGSGAGFNPVAMSMGMAVGNSIGNNIANAMNGSLAQNNQVTPPPIPADEYYIAKDGQPIGPFSVATIQNRLNEGSITAETLVWKNGMEQWTQVGTLDAFSVSAINIPPIPPS